MRQIRGDGEKDRDKAMGMSASNKFLRQGLQQHVAAA